MPTPSSKQRTSSSPKGATGKPAGKPAREQETRRRLPNGMGQPIMVRPQPKHRELVEVKSKELGVSMGLLAERLLAAGIRAFRKSGVDALELPEVK